MPHVVTRSVLLATIFAIASCMGIQQTRAACNPVSSEAISQLELDEGRLTSRHILNALEQAPRARKACELSLLVDYVLDQKLAEFAKSDRDADGALTCGLTALPNAVINNIERRTKALEALARLDRPWSVTGEDGSNETTKAADALYSLLLCVDATGENLTSDAPLPRPSLQGDRPQYVTAPPELGRTLRNFRRAIEAAHANVAGGFIAKTLGKEGSADACETAKRRRLLLKKYRRYEHSEYAIRAALLAASGNISALWDGECGQGDWLGEAEAILEGLFDRDSRSFSASIEGWRWVNDTKYYLAIVYLLRGEKEKFANTLQELAQGADILADTGIYRSETVDHVHPVSRHLISAIAREREAKNIPPYRDQVYVYNFIASADIPGLSPVAKYFSTDNLVEGLRSIGADAHYRCKDTCRENLQALETAMREKALRRDLHVVLGSFREKESAFRFRIHLCLRLFASTGSCPLGVDEVGHFYRVANGPLTDAAAESFIKRLKEKEIRDFFISRPRVLGVL